MLVLRDGDTALQTLAPLLATEAPETDAVALQLVRQQERGSTLFTPLPLADAVRRARGAREAARRW
ncbi:MAG: hypothetical protein ACOZQL_19485 [Myxococcota bacterium]